jgi:hypothetical protein
MGVDHLEEQPRVDLDVEFEGFGVFVVEDQHTVACDFLLVALFCDGVGLEQLAALLLGDLLALRVIT